MDLPSEQGRLLAWVYPGREQTETEETGLLRWPVAGLRSRFAEARIKINCHQQAHLSS
jgi:hypothetical protein